MVENMKSDETKEVLEPKSHDFEGCQEYVNNLCGKEILQLKGNSIPRGLVPLEKFFDPNSVAREPQLVARWEDVEDVNIGT